MSVDFSRTRKTPTLPLAAVLAAIIAALVVAAVSLASAARAAGPPDVLLGTSAQFAVLAADGVTNTGTTNVTGDVGSFATTTVTDNGAILPPGNVRRGPDTVVSDAKGDLLTAFNQAAGAQTSTSLLGPDIGGQTLTGGTYNRAGSLGFSGTLTLDGENDPSSVFLIQVGQDFTTATGASVLLTRGAQACHVYWQIGNDAVVQVGTAFKGNLLAGNDISALTGATFEGRLLTNDGAVTLDTNTITLPTCAPVVVPTTPAPTLTTPAPTKATPTKAKPTRSTPTTSKGRHDDDAAGGSGSGGSGSDGSGSGSGGSGSGDGGGDADGTFTTTSTPDLPGAGGPPWFLAPFGGVALLAGLGLVIAARRPRGTHRS
jgi:uncharacterized membrane protein YgcG